jgi:ribokinase
MVVLLVGDANADVSASLERFPREGDDAPISALGWGSGGSAANVATALARLGGKARLLARLGRDPAGDIAQKAAERAGVELGFVQRDDTLATGLCIAAISPDGERTFLSFRGANVALALPDAGEVLRDVELVHIAGHALLEGEQRATALALIEEANRRGIYVSLDVCLPVARTRPEEISSLSPRISALFANTRELEALAPEGDAGDRVEAALAALASRGARLVVGKLGACGAIVAEGAKRTRIEAMPVEARDTTGAGDGFVAAFLYAHLCGAPPDAAARLGNVMGALVASRPGAADSLPSREEFLQTLEARGAWDELAVLSPRGSGRDT